MNVAIDAFDCAVLVLDSNLELVAANRAANDQLGDSPGSFLAHILGAEPTSASRASTPDRLVGGLRGVLLGLEPEMRFDSVQTPDGATYQVVVRSLDDSSGHSRFLVLTAYDVTDKVLARQRIDGLRRIAHCLARTDDLTESLEAVAEEAPLLLGSQKGAIFLLDSEGDVGLSKGWGISGDVLDAIEIRSSVLGPITNWTAGSSDPIVVPDMAAVPGVDRALALQAGIRTLVAMPLMAEGRNRGVLTFAYATPDRSLTAEEFAVAEAISDQIAAVAARSELVARLSQEALTDPLTGLANRRAFERALTRHHAQSVRLQRPYAVLMADLDGMKQINDRLGHAAGDLALQEAARALVIATRTGDLVARVGGDEFAVLLSDADSNGATMVVERLTMAVEAGQPIYKGERVRVRISAGAAAFPEHGQNITGLLEAADEALYQVKAKRTGPKS